jgi:hypothetical protein
MNYLISDILTELEKQYAAGKTPTKLICGIEIGKQLKRDLKAEQYFFITPTIVKVFGLDFDCSSTFAFDKWVIK